MGKAIKGRKEGPSRLENALDSLKQLFEQKIMFGGAQSLLSIILIGSETTQNPLNDDDNRGFQNIHMIRDLTKLDSQIIKVLETDVLLQREETSDWIEGLLVALGQFKTVCGTKKFSKRIFLITDGESQLQGEEDLEEIGQEIKNLGVKINCIAMDFCNDLEDESDNDEEMKEGDVGGQRKKKRAQFKETKTQKINRKYLEDLIDKVDGSLFPAKIANQIFHQFAKKSNACRSKFRGQLELSKDLKLNVSVFSKTTQATLPSLKKNSLIVDYDKDVKKGGIERKVHYSEMEDADNKAVDASEVIKAHFYGK